MHVIKRTIVLSAPIADVFSFFQDPRNLAGITPRWMGFDITHVDEGGMRDGFKIVHRIKWMDVSLRWVTRIKDYDPPHGFLDVQTSGPYKVWRHQHTFEETARGTVMRDLVRYELPFGILGEVAHVLVVRRQLTRIFNYRSRRIAQLFTSLDAADAAPATVS